MKPFFAEGEPASEAKRKVVSGVQGQSPWENFKVLELSKRRKHYRKRAQTNKKHYHFPKLAARLELDSDWNQKET